MSANNNLRIELTSTAIPQSTDGYYSWDKISFLFPHEPIRREILRGKIALENCNLTLHPWKLKYLSKWLVEFLLPMIHDHHEAEDLYIHPEYIQKKGVVLPKEIEGAHEALDTILKNLENIVIELNNSYQEEKFQELKRLYEDFQKGFLKHLADEETFWPPILLETGESFFNEVNTIMHEKTKQQKSAKLFIMSVFDAMGYEFDINQPTHHLQYDTRWCNEQLLNEKIINKIPYFVRSWIFSPMNTKYQFYKRLIFAVAYGNEDNIPLEGESSSCLIC